MIMRVDLELAGATVARREEHAARADPMPCWQRSEGVLGCTCPGNRSAAYPQGLSLKAAWGGREHFFVGSRRLSVDDDNYLVLNEGAHYTCVADAAIPVRSFSVYFRPELVSGILDAMTIAPRQSIDGRSQGATRAPWFGEHLRPHDAWVTPVLEGLRAFIDAGGADRDWYEDQLRILLMRLVESERRFRQAANDILMVQSSTRDELLRRVRTAADYIHSNYTRPISLDDIAAAANLSKFYLVRLFGQVLGTTPHAYLRRKRLTAARRLIEHSDLCLAEVADLVGFGSRSAMFRQLRQQFGVAGQALRRAGQIVQGETAEMT